MEDRGIRELLMGVTLGLTEGQGEFTEEQALAVVRDLERAETSGGVSGKRLARMVRDQRLKITIDDAGKVHYVEPEGDREVILPVTPPSRCPAGTRRVDIAGVPKGVVLAALFNSSPPMGHGRLQGLIIGQPIGPPRGEELYRQFGPNFETLGGRRLHVDLSGDSFDPTRYDEWVGPGAAEAAVRPVREAGPMAWTFQEKGEPGMEGQPFTREEAPNALPNGTTVVKVNTLDEAHDDYEEEVALTGAVDGDRGVVLGSTLSVWGEGSVPRPAEVIYYVEWDHDPKVAYHVAASGVAPVR